MISARGLSLALFLSACSSASSGDGAAAGFPANAFVTVASTSGALSVDVRSSPQPPERGVVDVEYTVHDASGKPVDGLTVVVTPWMVSHGHGASVRPTVTAQGQGKYLVTGVSLFMAGRWELRTEVSGPTSDSLAPAFEVQ